MTYKDSGVDIEAAGASARRIGARMERTFDPRVIDWPRGFAGLFALRGEAQLFTRRYRRPVLVSGTDGVGTKLKIAFALDRHDTVGVDLVAMCVNDIVVCGAEPLFFLDYFATGKLEPRVFEAVVDGIARGCELAGCALISGETAELPGFYASGEYDLAGFAVGVVEQKRLLRGAAVRPGDLVIGLHSSGLHANGYSLVRQVLLEKAKLKLEAAVDELGCALGEELLRPTLIYARAVQRALRYYRKKQPVHAIAHITGGGLVGNIPRVLPKNCAVKLDRKAWEVPPIFGLIQKLGQVEDEEMCRVFNLGIGMVMIVAPYYAESVRRTLKRAGYLSSIIGKVKRGKRGVELA